MKKKRQIDRVVIFCSFQSAWGASVNFDVWIVSLISLVDQCKIFDFLVQKNLQIKYAKIL
jgi:hypothetical protein